MEKQTPKNAMQYLINQVRKDVPFDLPIEKICTGQCRGCPKKLIEYLDSELSFWQQKLDNKDYPTLGDVDKLFRTSKKIYTNLKRNNLIDVDIDDDRLLVDIN